MFIGRSISRSFFVFIMAVSLLFNTAGVIPVQLVHAKGSSVPAKSNTNHLSQVKARIPATTINIQQAYLKASNTYPNDNFGQVVAISGDTLVVGAPYEDSNAVGIDGDQTNNSIHSSGAVYVFTRTGNVWSQQAYIKASNPDVIDYFGSAIAIDGDTLVVGAYGESSNATGVNGDQSNNSYFEAGAVYVFTRSGGVWSQQAYLKASNPWGGDIVNQPSGDLFGQSVSISGDTLVVGAPIEGSNATGVNGDQTNDLAEISGAAYVFTRSGSDWSQQAYIKASNTDAGDGFGSAVAITGDTMVVGAPWESSNATGINGNQADNSALYAGAAYVFTRSGSDWSQQAYLKASDTLGWSQFGSSLTISGDTVVVGANWAQQKKGEAYIFTRSGTDWSQQASLISPDPRFDDQFGQSLAISGDRLIVGVPYEDGTATGVNGPDNPQSDGATDSGAAYVFIRNGNAWNEEAYVKASNTGEYNGFGNSVAVSGSTIVAGAPYEDSEAVGINGDQTGSGAPNAGAAYVLAIPPLVISSLPADSNPTKAANIHFSVTFAASMTGVDISDFHLTTTGAVTGAAITDVSGGPLIYTVTATIGTGEGTIQLDVMDDDTILDAGLNPLGGTGTGNGDFTSGTAYTIDRTAPTVTSIEIVPPDPISTHVEEDFDVHFSEPVTGVDISDFRAIMSGGLTGASVVYVSGSDTHYVVSIDTGQHVGSIRLSLVDNDSIVDTALNPLGGVGAGNGNLIGAPYYEDRTFTATFLANSTLTGWVLESSENSNVGGTMNSTASIFQIGDDGANRQYRTMLSFNTASLPDGAVVKSATLNIDQWGALVGKNPFNVLGKLWTDIRKGWFGSTAVLQPKDFSAPASATKVGYFYKFYTLGYNSDLNAAGRSNINKLGVTQFRLYFALDDNNNHKADYMKFADNYNPPTLTITYLLP